jgi:hypothetical protein
MARRDLVGIRLLTRRGNDWSSRFPLVVEAVNHFKSASTARRCAATTIEARRREGYKVHFDDRCTAEISVARLGTGEKRPTKAIAKIANTRIEPRTAFALSHLSHSRGFLR